MEQEGHIIRLKRGLYVRSSDDGATIIPMLIANHIYGPSYVSMHTALRHYGLIPERVYETQSMTIKHSRNFDTPIGRFSYHSCPPSYFSLGIRQESQGNDTYLIASPEKALCDLILKTPGLATSSIKSLNGWLAEDLRFDMDAINHFDVALLEQCGKLASVKNNMITLLIKLIQR